MKKVLFVPKNHAHDREITSNWKEPNKIFLRDCARAMRLAKMLAKEPEWTVWHQLELPKILQDRVSKLAFDPRWESFCPCGQHKSHSLVFAKADASQFFKDANTKRACMRAKALFNRITQKNRVQCSGYQKTGKSKRTPLQSEYTVQHAL